MEIALAQKGFNNILVKLCTEYTNRIAYTYEGLDVTYKQLILMSNFMIKKFMDVGIKKNDRVLFFTDEPIVAAIGFITCLRTGIVCIPVDLESNPFKLVNIVKESMARHIVVSGNTLDEIKSLNLDNLNKINFDNVEELDTDVSKYINNQMSDQAFIFFTSGSTGTPKGVITPVSALLTYMIQTATYYKFSSEDTFLSHAPMHTDMCLFSLFVPLVVGGKCVLISQKYRWIPEYVKSRIINRSISVLHMVPSVLNLLMTSNKELAWGRTVKNLFLTGEKFPSQQLKSIKSFFPFAKITNIYGSTETNDSFSYSVEIKNNYLEDIPIGRPYDYVDAINLKEDLSFCNEGEIGELFIRSETNMLGYLNHQKEDCLTYIKHFDSHFFPTGDLVKVINDCFYFVGRKHGRLKINGYNISISEIEEVLFNYPSVNEVAVIADDREGDRINLIAFISSNTNISTLDLRSHCSKKLPRYSIPKRYVILSSMLPKSSSGKLDRLALNECYMKGKTSL